MGSRDFPHHQHRFELRNRGHDDMGWWNLFVCPFCGEERKLNAGLTPKNTWGGYRTELPHHGYDCRCDDCIDCCSGGSK